MKKIVQIMSLLLKLKARDKNEAQENGGFK
jgi:hypothetical protein